MAMIENTNRKVASGKQQVRDEQGSEWRGRSVKIGEKKGGRGGRLRGEEDKRQQAEHTAIPSQQCW